MQKPEYSKWEKNNGPPNGTNLMNTGERKKKSLACADGWSWQAETVNYAV